MKVMPVSFYSFKSNKNNYNFDSSFLYTMPERKQDDSILPKYIMATGLAALSAVIVTLFNIGRKKQLPYNIVEISDLSKGLNKIKTNEKLVESIKNDFIYPVKAFLSGDKKIKSSVNYKSGLILTGSNYKSLEQMSEALCEHFNELNIRTVSISSTAKRIKDGVEIETPLRRNTLNKRVFKEIIAASKKYNEHGVFTVINLGNLDKLTDLKIVKSQKSNFEKLLAKLSNDEHSGVVWVGWTTKQKAIPLFLNDLPISVKKVA